MTYKSYSVHSEARADRWWWDASERGWCFSLCWSEGPWKTDIPSAVSLFSPSACRRPHTGPSSRHRTRLQCDSAAGRFQTCETPEKWVQNNTVRKQFLGLKRHVHLVDWRVLPYCYRCDEVLHVFWSQVMFFLLRTELSGFVLGAHVLWVLPVTHDHLWVHHSNDRKLRHCERLEVFVPQCLSGRVFGVARGLNGRVSLHLSDAEALILVWRALHVSVLPIQSAAVRETHRSATVPHQRRDLIPELDRQTERERHRWAKAQTQHEDDMMSALKASLTLGLDSVTDSSSISCSLPREIHGWDSGVFGTIMSSSSSSSTSSSSSPCTGDYKHNLYKKKLKSQNYPSIRPSIAHLQHVPFGLFCEHQIEALSVCEVSVKHQQKFIFRVLLQKNNSTEKNKTDLSGSEPSVNH